MHTSKFNISKSDLSLPPYLSVLPLIFSISVNGFSSSQIQWCLWTSVPLFLSICLQILSMYPHRALHINPFLSSLMPWLKTWPPSSLVNYYNNLLTVLSFLIYSTHCANVIFLKCKYDHVSLLFKYSRQPSFPCVCKLFQTSPKAFSSFISFTLHNFPLL